MPDMNDFYAFKNTSGGSGSSSDFNGLKFILVVIIISIVFGILEALGNWERMIFMCEKVGFEVYKRPKYIPDGVKDESEYTYTPPRVINHEKHL